MEKVTVSAYYKDYNEKAWKFLYGKNQCEFLPKSQVILIEKAGNTAYFEMPKWLADGLKGRNFYSFL